MCRRITLEEEVLPEEPSIFDYETYENDEDIPYESAMDV